MSTTPKVVYSIHDAINLKYDNLKKLSERSQQPTTTTTTTTSDWEMGLRVLVMIIFCVVLLMVAGMLAYCLYVCKRPLRNSRAQPTTRTQHAPLTTFRLNRSTFGNMRGAMFGNVTGNRSDTGTANETSQVNINTGRSQVNVNTGNTLTDSVSIEQLNGSV